MALPEIATDRLRLRPFGAGDVAEFHSIWGDPEVIWWGAATDRESAQSSLAGLVERIAVMPEGLGWSWLVAGDGTVVGDVCLQPAPEPFGGIEIGWHVARPHWGKGYATEGAAPLIPHGWALGLEEVIATIIPVNVPSIRVAEKLGMVRRGPTKNRGALAHGIWVATRPLSAGPGRWGVAQG
jgi:RimJ/RimL family protein N-acetyltransferase